MNAKSKKVENPTKQKQDKISQQMFFLILIVAGIVGFLLWNLYIERQVILDANLPPAGTKIYNATPIAINTNDFIQEYESNQGKPILLYFYTSWCSVCKKNLVNINEIARLFQNSDLHLIAIAIDKNISLDDLSEHLSVEAKLYFPPRYLAFREGFVSFLDNKGVQYHSRIPFTALISRDGRVVTKFNGIKSVEYLKKKILTNLN